MPGIERERSLEDLPRLGRLTKSHINVSEGIQKTGARGTNLGRALEEMRRLFELPLDVVGKSESENDLVLIVDLIRERGATRCLDLTPAELDVALLVVARGQSWIRRDPRQQWKPPTEA